MTDYAVKYVTARQRVLAELMPLQWRSWRILRRIGGVRYGARLRELKRLGYRIEDTSGNDNEGKVYRLINPRPARPAIKQVKIYLPEEHVKALLRDELYPETKTIALEALRIFQANRHKL